MADWVGISAVFYGYATIGVLGALFIRVYVPETRGLTLEQASS
jgi:hypothetical protein